MRKIIITLFSLLMLISGCSSNKELISDKNIIKEISDSMNTADFIIDKEYYALPCSLNKFLENGWKSNIKLNSKRTIIYKEAVDITLSKGKKKVLVSAVNSSATPIKLNKNSQIGKVTYVANYEKAQETDFVTKKGLNITSNPKSAQTKFAKEKNYFKDDNGFRILDNGILKIHFFREKEKATIALSLVSSKYVAYASESKRDAALEDRKKRIKGVSYSSMKNYPAEKYADFIKKLQELKDEKFYPMNTGTIESGPIPSDSLFEGKVVGEDLYIINNDDGTKYAIYNVADGISVPKLNAGDKITFCGEINPSIPLIQISKSEYIPVVIPYLIEVDGVDIFNVSLSVF